MKQRASTFNYRSVLVVCGIVLYAAFAVQASGHSGLPLGAQAGGAKPTPSQQRQLADSYGKLPLSFEPNFGQTDPLVNFISRGQGYTLFLAPTEAVLRLNAPEPDPLNAASSPPADLTSALLTMKLLGAQAGAAAAGMDELPGKANYFLGNDPAKWRKNIPTYKKVAYYSIYPGVDLIYYGNQRQLEYDFVVAPGASPRAITLGFDGAQPMIDASGDLVLHSESGAVRFHAPVIYQETTGARQKIEGRYSLDAQNLVRFEVGAYDHQKPLVIDPVLGYSTLLGGSYEDQALAIAIDKSGNAYVAGYTCSTDFPVTPGAYQTVHTGGVGGNCNPYNANPGLKDVFVSKLNASGTGLIYSTYIGGSNYDAATGIAVDSQGNAYVTGGTASQDFPTTANAFQRVCGPENVWNNDTCSLIAVQSTCSYSQSFNGFVTKLDPTGSTLVYSTYLGGTGNDQLDSIAVDSLGEAHVAGFASSKAYADISCFVNGNYLPVSYPYPTTASAYEGIAPTQYTSPTNDLWYWVFSKLSADGSSLLYSSDLYGPGLHGEENFGTALALDNAGAAYVTGYVYDGGFPTTSGAFQSTCASCPTYPDAFVAKFDPTKSGAASLVYGTYLGGDGSDAGFAIAADSSGNAYVAGATGEIAGGNDPTSTNFPTTKKAFQRTCPGSCAPSGNSWLAKLNPTASSLVYSTYFGGGTSNERTTIYGLALGPAGKVFVTGYTKDPAFPTKNPIQGYLDSSFGDAFITEFNSTASALLFSSPIGGSGPDSGDGIAADSKGNAYVAGGTGSTTGAPPYFPTTPGAFQTGCGDLGTCNGYLDGFVLKLLAVNVAADLMLTNAPSPSPVKSGTDLTFTIVASNLGPSTATSVTMTDAVPAGTTFVSVATTAGTCTAPPVGGTGTVKCSGFDLTAGASATVTMVVQVNAKPGKTVKDTAKISSPVLDPNPANNTATVTVPVN